MTRLDGDEAESMCLYKSNILWILSAVSRHTALSPSASWMTKSPAGEGQGSVKALVTVASDSSQLQKCHGFSVSL